LSHAPEPGLRDLVWRKASHKTDSFQYLPKETDFICSGVWTSSNVRTFSRAGEVVMKGNRFMDLMLIWPRLLASYFAEENWGMNKISGKSPPGNGLNLNHKPQVPMEFQFGLIYRTIYTLGNC
jgi:hypothetical protein